MQNLRRWRLVGLVLVALVMLAVPGLGLAGANPLTGGAPQSALQNEYYIVRPGDNLTFIAYRFGTTVAELVRLNNLPNPNVIYVGQQLLIRQGGGGPAPTATPAPTQPPSGNDVYHTVRPGDTVYGIAALYRVTPQQIITLNNLANPNLIYVGQRLLISRGGGGGTPPPQPHAKPKPDPTPAIRLYDGLGHSRTIPESGHGGSQPRRERYEPAMAQTANTLGRF